MPKAVKKKLGWSTIFYELKGVVKAKIAQNNSQVSEGGITVKPGQDSIHELIIWKVNPFVASVTCSRYQIAFKWSVNFWLQLFSIRWDGKYFNGWNFYLGILQIQENWAGRNFITNSRVYSLLITQAKMQTEINNNLRMAAFWPIGTAQIIRIVCYPIRNKSRFWLFCMWSVKEMYHALLPKTDYRDKGGAHDRRLDTYDRMICQVTTHCVFVLKP